MQGINTKDFQRDDITKTEKIINILLFAIYLIVLLTFFKIIIRKLRKIPLQYFQKIHFLIISLITGGILAR